MGRILEGCRAMGRESKVVTNTTNTFIVTGIVVRNCGREKVTALRDAK
jgi:hypothetical protein